MMQKYQTLASRWSVSEYVVTFRKCLNLRSRSLKDYYAPVYAIPGSFFIVIIYFIQITLL